MANTLAKIVAKAKQIRKSRPNKYKGKKAWQSYVKDAAKQVKKKAPRKKAVGRVVAKRKPVKKAATKSRPRAKKKAVRKVTVTRSVSVVGKRQVGKVGKVGKVGQARKRRKVGARGGVSTTMLIAGGLGLLALYMLTSKKDPQLPPQAPPLVSTSNPVRDQKANDIVSYAVAGGLAVDAIIKLINSLNQSDGSQVSDVYDSINSGSGIPPYLIA